jgi:hypothetical protein
MCVCECVGVDVIIVRYANIMCADVFVYRVCVCVCQCAFVSVCEYVWVYKVHKTDNTLFRSEVVAT